MNLEADFRPSSRRSKDLLDSDHRYCSRYTGTEFSVGEAWSGWESTETWERSVSEGLSDSNIRRTYLDVHPESCYTVLGLSDQDKGTNANLISTTSTSMIVSWHRPDHDVALAWPGERSALLADRWKRILCHGGWNIWILGSDVICDDYLTFIRSLNMKETPQQAFCSYCRGCFSRQSRGQTQKPDVKESCPSNLVKSSQWEKERSL